MIELFGITFSPSLYGGAYALGFIVGYYLIKKEKRIFKYHLDDLFVYIFLGVVLGGRLGYILFYNLNYYITHPLEVFMVWNGGMAFHGGVIGVMIAMYIFSIRKKISFLMIADEIARVLPIGLFLGRVANYFNKELLGFPYEGFLAVQTATGSFFPSPLIEAILEGIILYFILNYVYKNRKFNGQTASIFLIGYGVFRIFVEVFFRLPDTHIGYILPYISMGTLLSTAMIIIGVCTYRKLGKVE